MSKCKESSDGEHQWVEDYTDMNDDGMMVVTILDREKEIPSHIEVDISLACYHCAETKDFGTHEYQLMKEQTIPPQKKEPKLSVIKLRKSFKELFRNIVGYKPKGLSKPTKKPNKRFSNAWLDSVVERG